MSSSRGKYKPASNRRAGGVRLEPRRTVMVIQGRKHISNEERERELAKVPDDERKKPGLARITAFVAPMFG